MSAAHAQSTAAHPTDAPSKIGIVNMSEIISGTAEGKQAAAELQSQFAPRQLELQKLQQQVEDDQTRLRTGQTTLSDDEKARITRESDTVTRTIQRKNQEDQDDLTAAQQDVVDRIGRRAVDILSKYGNDNGYAAILDTSSQQTTVVFAGKNNDITQDIIRIYDQTYPVKAAAAATPKPSTPKPTPAKPQP
jgi:Skp family chaperone for outer membrane proteins